MIEGKKVILRPFEIEDAIHLHDLRKDIKGIKDYIGSPLPSNLESEKEWISRMYPKGDRHVISFVIEQKENKMFSGYCNVRNIDYINSHAEVGIILSKNSRGKGLIVDVSFALYAYLFNEINLHKVFALVLTDNTLALKSHQKIGFKVEGEIKEHIYQDGLYKDVHFVSLYRDDFFKKYSEYLESL
jgi:RimJ/RimL family protein N-acetyltransferase